MDSVFVSLPKVLLAEIVIAFAPAIKLRGIVTFLETVE